MELGVEDIYVNFNNIKINQLDNTYKNGSKYINSITATPGVISHIEGSRLFKVNKITLINHRAYMIDINLERYFSE